MTRHGYQGVSSWKDGIYDVRSHNWEHPWIVVSKGVVNGCWSRNEARLLWVIFKSLSQESEDVHGEATVIEEYET